MLTQHNRDGRWRNKISVGSWSTGNGDNRTREKKYTVLRSSSVFKMFFSAPPSNDDWQSHWSSPYSARQDPSPNTIRCTPLHFLLHCHSFPQIPLSNTQISLKSLSLSLSHSLSEWLLLLLPPSTAPFPSDFDLRLVKADLDKPRLQTTQFVSPNTPAIQYCQEDRKRKPELFLKKDSQDARAGETKKKRKPRRERERE
jgi:hypothetical protein